MSKTNSRHVMLVPWHGSNSSLCSLLCWEWIQPPRKVRPSLSSTYSAPTPRICHPYQSLAIISPVSFTPNPLVMDINGGPSLCPAQQSHVPTSASGTQSVPYTGPWLSNLKTTLCTWRWWHLDLCHTSPIQEHCLSNEAGTLPCILEGVSSVAVSGCVLCLFPF